MEFVEHSQLLDWKLDVQFQDSVGVVMTLVIFIQGEDMMMLYILFSSQCSLLL